MVGRTGALVGIIVIVGCGASAGSEETAPSLDAGRVDAPAFAATDGAAPCALGESRACDAPEGKGDCKSGQQRCVAAGEFTRWGACQPGAPREEVCFNGRDEDCTGVADDGCAPLRVDAPAITSADPGCLALTGRAHALLPPTGFRARVLKVTFESAVGALTYAGPALPREVGGTGDLTLPLTFCRGSVGGRTVQWRYTVKVDWELLDPGGATLGAGQAVGTGSGAAS